MLLSPLARYLIAALLVTVATVTLQAQHTGGFRPLDTSLHILPPYQLETQELISIGMGSGITLDAMRVANGEEPVASLCRLTSYGYTSDLTADEARALAEDLRELQDISKLPQRPQHPTAFFRSVPGKADLRLEWSGSWTFLLDTDEAEDRGQLELQAGKVLSLADALLQCAQMPQ